MARSTFDGFPLESLAFLDQLSVNNNRDWFNANKQRYEDLIREPSLEFIEAMAAPLQKISPHFRAVAKKTGGSLMRVYRDTRFAKDKTPYKTNVGIHFRHEAGCDVHAPGFYLHIDTNEVFVGAGVWHPDSAALGKIREAIDNDPATWKRASRGKAFRSKYELAGDSLKRPPRGYDADHPLIDDLKRKDHIAMCRLDHDDLFEPTVVKHVAATFRSAKTYVRFLCEAIDVPF